MTCMDLKAPSSSSSSPLLKLTPPHTHKHTHSHYAPIYTSVSQTISSFQISNSKWHMNTSVAHKSSILMLLKYKYSNKSYKIWTIPRCKNSKSFTSMIWLFPGQKFPFGIHLPNQRICTRWVQNAVCKQTCCCGRSLQETTWCLVHVYAEQPPALQ